MDKLLLVNTINCKMHPICRGETFRVACIVNYLIMDTSGYPEYILFNYDHLWNFNIHKKICGPKLNLVCKDWWCADLRSIPVMIEWSKDKSKRIFIG